jgi:hypothetical protein
MVLFALLHYALRASHALPSHRAHPARPISPDKNATLHSWKWQQNGCESSSSPLMGAKESLQCFEI